MKNIKGIVCVCSDSSLHQKYHFLFGKNNEQGKCNYRNFQSGLTPFCEIDEARQALEQIRQRRDIQPTGLCYITMKLAENIEECESLKKEKTLIAVESMVDNGKNISPWDEVTLYGRRVEGCPGFDSRAEISDNGLQPYKEEKWKSINVYSGPRVKTITAYEQAMHAAREITRQHITLATVATFRLRKIKF